MNAADTSTAFHRSLRRTASFLYRHSPSLVLVSVCWVVGSLPLVTAGPATLGAYAAIRSIRTEGRLRSRDVRRTLRRHGLNATLLGVVPIIVGVVTVIYFYRYVTTDGIQYLVLSVAGVYLGSFLSLVSLTTFVGIAGSSGFAESVTDGYRWVIRNPLLSTMTVLAFGVIVLVGVVSVVGIIIIVPGVLFSFHTEVVRNSSTPDDDGVADDGREPSSAS